MTAKDILLAVMHLNSWDQDVAKLDIDEVYCMSVNVYHESRGEPLETQYGVAHVVKNRTKKRDYPGSICGVIKDSAIVRGKRVCQFSWYCNKTKMVKVFENGRIVPATEVESFKRAVKVAINTLTNKKKDNTYGSTNFYNFHEVTPRWGDYKKTVKLGKIQFAKTG